MDWLIWGLLLFLQQFSQTLSSRAKNSSNILYGALAGVFSHGVWFTSLYYIVKHQQSGSRLVAAVFYVTMCVAGTVASQTLAIRYETRKGLRKMGEREHLVEEKATFEGGATRSAKAERYDLIPPEADEANALRFGLGAGKHGEHNWKNGGAAFISQCINHTRAHIVSLQKHGPFHDDDDIGAVLANTSMLAWFRAHKPDEFLKALGMSAPPVPLSQPVRDEYLPNPF